MTETKLSCPRKLSTDLGKVLQWRREAKLLIDERMYAFHSHSGVTGPTFTKRLHTVTRLSHMNLLKSELRYSTPFKNDKITTEGESTDFAHFNLKLVAIWQSPLTDHKKSWSNQ